MQKAGVDTLKTQKKGKQMKIQEIIDNLITIKEYYTPEREFSYYGEEYEPLSKEENAAIENAIEILESLKGETE